MKNTLAIILLVATTLVAYSQENMVTLSGGYAFANIEEADADGTGFRINGLYEFNPSSGKFAHGLSIGYISLTGEGALDTEYDIGTWPVYYAPKFLVGEGNLKGFVKAAVGWQFSNISATTTGLSVDANDSGFALGGGAGASLFFSEKLFLTAEYEFLWLQNSFFKEGYLNTASLGLGFKF